MRTQTERMQTADTILQQLGGRVFVMMTGAKTFTASDSGVTFRVPGTMTTNRINLVAVDLTPADTYRVRFIRAYGASVRVVAEFDDVYCDQLRDLFERQTGLATRLSVRDQLRDFFVGGAR